MSAATGRARAQRVASSATALLLFAILGSSDTITVFGPKTYKRGHGEPVWVKDTFSVSNTSLQYTLRVKNGGNGQFDEVKDATVKLNGQVVLDQDDFEHCHNSLIQKTVTLAASNEIAVRVKGKPGSGFILDIFGTVTDNTPPTITATASPAANAAGWNNTNVTVSFTCSDAGSGIATCPAPIVVSAEGVGQRISGTATDRAGNSASASVTLNIDKTPPQITANPAPPANPAGWNDSDVTVSFACSDGLSGVAASCPAAVSVTTDGAGQAVARSVSDVAGNSASASLTLNIDKGQPGISASISPPPNAAGWNNSDATVTFTCTDGVSGVASCPPPVTLTAEGAGQPVSGTTTNRAGRSASTSVTLNIDKTPPTLSASAAPPPNAAGWNNTDVSVSFSCSDSLSGIAACPDAATVGTEGAGQSVPGVAVDLAGNSAGASLTLNIDKTPPTLSARVTPEANAAGWHNTSVVVAFDATDGLSGVDTVSPAVEVTDEGKELSVAGSAADRAGNAATTYAALNIDKTPPVIVIDSPSPGELRRLPRVEVSGTATDENDVVSVKVNEIELGGRPAFSSELLLTPGAQDVVVQARDVADNGSSARVAVTYRPLPAIRITSPVNLTALGSSPISVSGTIDDPQATITVGVERVPAVVSGNSFVAAGVPLREGGNVLTAVATTPGGDAGTDSVTVVLDTTAPRVVIDSPPNGSTLTSDTVVVTGRVNDVVLGTVNSGQAQVEVNGIPAEIANRTFIVRGLPLAPGQNSLTATARDAVGNFDTKTTTVFRESLPGPHLTLLSGDQQSSTIGQPLPQPLAVALSDAAGNPLAGRSVIFRIAEGNGALQDASGEVARGLVITTNELGRAAASFVVGSRFGEGNNRVDVTSPGVPGGVVFTASVQAGTPDKISVDSGSGQRGAASQPLPRPFVAVVTDSGHNRLPGISVTFSVVSGGGHFNGEASVTAETDGDGRALALLTLGTEPGIENNVVTASIGNLEVSPAGFHASAVEPADASQTTISGVVLDNSNVPVPGVTLRVRGTSLAAASDAQGQFLLSGVPVGDVHLLVDGSTAQRPGTWPDLEFEMVTVAGIDNTLGLPIFLLPLDTANGIFVDETHGGVLTLPDFPGFSLTVAPNSATFPDGTRRGTITVTAVHADKVPMVPNFGQQPRFIVTIQPPGVRFDPPAPVTHPNVDGLEPGAVTELYSFDHDMGSFVATGTATVSEDGSVLRSDAGTGIIKGGWHCGGDPNKTGTPHCCPVCLKCNETTKLCEPDPATEGKPCDPRLACKLPPKKIPNPPENKGFCENGKCRTCPKSIDLTHLDNFVFPTDQLFDGNWFQGVPIRTGAGIVSTMTVRPDDVDFKGLHIKEIITLVSNDCPKAVPVCVAQGSGHTNAGFIVERPPYTDIFGRQINLAHNTFQDAHLRMAAADFLGGTKVDTCTMVCHQSYTCDDGTTIANEFDITSEFTHSTYKKQGVTIVKVTKTQK